MVFVILTAAQVLFGGLECHLHSLDGSTLFGELVSLSDQSVVVKVDGKDQSLPLEAVLRIEASQDTPALRAQFHIEFRGGSHCGVEQFVLQDDNVTITLGENQHQIPSHKIRAIRWGTKQPGLAVQWSEIGAVPHAGDVVVIRKGADTLDYLEGIVTGMADGTVKFRYEDESIDIPFAKLYGVFFYGADREQTERAAGANLVFTDGNWTAQNVEISGDTVSWATSDGLHMSHSLARLRTIDFGADKLLYLSDVEPVSVTVTPQFASSLAGLNQLLYAPRRNQAFYGQPLQLKFHERAVSQTYAKGLALHSRTELTFRLQNEFRHLRGIVGVDPTGSSGGSVQLEILADGESLLSTLVTGLDEPRDLDLDVSGRGRLTIIVDYGDQLDLADRLHLCDLRVIK